MVVCGGLNLYREERGGLNLYRGNAWWVEFGPGKCEGGRREME